MCKKQCNDCKWYKVYSKSTLERELNYELKRSIANERIIISLIHAVKWSY